jgi:hypothetical protein
MSGACVLLCTRLPWGDTRTTTPIVVLVRVRRPSGTFQALLAALASERHAELINGSLRVFAAKRFTGGLRSKRE